MMALSKRSKLAMSAALLASLSAAPVQAETERQEQAQEQPPAIEALLGQLVEGGEWRTPNPDYVADSGQPAEYAVRYAWGPYKQHMIGELLGIFPSEEGEKEARFWTLYAIHNPVTGKTSALQIGWNGSIADGTMEKDEQGRLVMDQTFFGIDGSSTRMLHIDTMDPSGNSYHANVYEMDDAGAWQPKREWTWTKHAKTAMLDGRWTPLSASLAGQAMPAESLKTVSLEISEDAYVATVDGTQDRGRLSYQDADDHPRLDIMGEEGPNAGRTYRAIYRLDGDRLTLAYDLSGATYPASFEPSGDSQQFVVTYERARP